MNVTSYLCHHCYIFSQERRFQISEKMGWGWLCFGDSVWMTKTESSFSPMLPSKGVKPKWPLQNSLKKPKKWERKGTKMQTIFKTQKRTISVSKAIVGMQAAKNLCSWCHLISVYVHIYLLTPSIHISNFDHLDIINLLIFPLRLASKWNLQLSWFSVSPLFLVVSCPISIFLKGFYEE